MLKNLPCNAGDTCLVPGWGMKIPHAAEQLSLHTTTRVHVLRPEIPHDTTKTQNSWGQKRLWCKSFLHVLCLSGLLLQVEEVASHCSSVDQVQIID